jgi:hypothetical protein
MEEHSPEYFFQFPGHEDVVFPTRDGLAAHLEDAHQEHVPANMSSTIALLGKHASKKILACL